MIKMEECYDRGKKVNGKMRNGLRKTYDTKKEKNLSKLVNKFNNCTLTEQEYRSIPPEERMIYLDKMIMKKYKCDSNISCEVCGHTVVFKESGYISDEELLSNENISKHFKHV